MSKIKELEKEKKLLEESIHNLEGERLWICEKIRFREVEIIKINGSIAEQKKNTVLFEVGDKVYHDTGMSCGECILSVNAHGVVEGVSQHGLNGAQSITVRFDPAHITIVLPECGCDMISLAKFIRDVSVHEFEDVGDTGDVNDISHIEKL